MKTKAILLAMLALCSSAPGASTYTWTGTTSGAWSLAANWGGSGPPISGDTARFNAPASNDTVVDVGTGGVSVNSIVFDTGTTNIHTISTGTGGITLDDNGSITYNVASTGSTGGKQTISVPLNIGPTGATFTNKNQGGGYGYGGNGSNPMEINGVLTGSGTITITGASSSSSMVSLGGSNLTSFTGNITVNSGQLRIGAANGLGDTAHGTTLNGGSLTVGASGSAEPITYANNSSTINIGNGSFAGPISVNSSRTLAISSGGGNSPTFSGAISGDSTTAFNITHGGSGATFTLSGTSANTLAGLTTLAPSGILVLAKTAGLDAIAGNLKVNSTSGTSGNNAVVKWTNSNQINDASIVTLNPTNAATKAILRLNGKSDVIGGLQNTGLAANAFVQNELASTAGLLGMTVTGANSYTFSGTIQDGDAASLGTLAIAKDGTGTQIFSGTNTYSGTTTVSNGTLVVNAAHTGTGAYSINTLGTLAGSGPISAAVTCAGTLSPGTTGTVGALTIGNTTLTGTYACDINGATADSLTTGTLNITGATLTFNIISPPTPTSYVITTYSGTLVGTFACSTVPANFVLDYSTPGQIKLVPTVPASALNSTVVASPTSVTADGVTTSTITVTLLDASSAPVVGRTVTLASSRGATDTISAASGPSNASGVVTFTVKSLTPGTPTFTATDITDGITVSTSPTVTFTATAVADAGLSTVTATPSSIVANGYAISLITVTLLDSSSNPILAKTVTLASNRGATDTISAASGLSNGSGVVTFTVKSTTPGTPVFTATDTSDSVTITQTATVTMTAPPPADVAQSTVVAVPTSLVADGTSTSTVTVTLKDSSGTACLAKTVTLASNRGASDTINTTSGVTDTSGVATFTVKSSTTGLAVLTATDTTDSVSITQTATVAFVKALGFKYTRSDALNATDIAGAPGYSQANWNTANAVSQGPPTTPINGLKDSAGTATGVNITTWTEATVNSWSLGDTASANAKLINSFSDTQPTIVLSGLDTTFPGGYDLIVYYSNNEGPSTSTLTLTGSVSDHATRSIRTGATASCSYSSVGFVNETGAVQPATTSSNYTIFTGLKDPGMTIAMTGTNNNGIAAIQIVQETGPPTTPSGPSPANLATDILNSTILNWNDSARATSYQVFLWRDGDTQPTSPTATTTTSDYTPPVALDYTTTYHWQVIAVGDLGTTAGPQWTFTTAAELPPVAVANPVPPDTATNIVLATSLSWDPAARAASYDCYLWKSSDSKPGTPTGSTTSTSFSPAAPLDPSTTYNWQITSVNGSGSTDGPVWSFTTGAVPATPASPAPAQDATGQPRILTLDWADSAGATSYQVFVWVDGDTEPATPTATTTLSELPASSLLLASTLYHWQVKALNAIGAAAGPVWNFTTSNTVSNQVSIGWHYDGPYSADTLAATDVAGIMPFAQVYWNYHAGIGQGPGALPFALVDNSGAATSASVTAWTQSSNNSWFHGQTANPNQKLLESFADQQPAITISNLPADYVANGYSVVVYYGNNEGPSTSTLSITGSINDSVSRSIITGNTTLSSYGTVGFIQETGTLSGPSNCTVFTGLNDPGFTVALTGANNNGISAIQIVRSVPTGTPYQIWATTNVGGQSASEDYNHDGVANGIAYFMGITGMATNPGVINGKVTWPHDPTAVVSSYGVQVSTDLVTWVAANPADVDEVSSPGNLIFTIPTGAVKTFCRLMVVP